ncbi:hypothetical protein PTKIN_Ptkin07bG0279300 [Pterospermum kingtungense]
MSRFWRGLKTVVQAPALSPAKSHHYHTIQAVPRECTRSRDRAQGIEFKVDVPVVFKGDEDCPGLKKGGYFNRIRTSLKFLCPAEHIPQKIEVDVSKLDIDDKSVHA